MSRTVYNDPDLARAYHRAYLLLKAIGMFPWQDKWVRIEARFYEVAGRRWPKEDWEGLIRGIRECE